MIRSGRGGLVVAVLIALSGAAPAALFAADSDSMAQSRSDLESVQRRLREIEQAITQSESERSAAEVKLMEAERAVSAAQRKIRALAAEQKAAEQELAQMTLRQQEVSQRIAARRNELGQWLRRHYMRGGSDVAPFLLARDPNQLARDVHYLEQLGHARLELIEALRADLDERTTLIASVQQRRDQLAALADARRKQHAELAKVQSARKQALAALAGQLREQREEAESLRRDEQQLAALIEVLERQAARREAALREAALRPPPPEGRTPPPRQMADDLERSLEIQPAGVSFAQLKGRMILPARGELTRRFGAQRDEGGARLRGVFIRAGDGEDVRAVAAGEVVYSDWLRGYGNLIIVDHGDDYLTVYGNNDTLFNLVGDRIVAGAPIASIGASGGVQESGLYFEIRHRGEPVDPMQWIKAR